MKTSAEYDPQQTSVKDYMEGEPQKKMAKLIAEVIEHRINGTDSDKNVIGVEGPWGSGKSNLLKHLEKELGNTESQLVDNSLKKCIFGEDYRDFVHRQVGFFKYDLWEHQDDSLRKGIIWNLTDYLRDIGWIKENGRCGNRNWFEERKKICSSKVEKKTSSLPKASIGAVFIVVLFLMGKEDWFGSFATWLASRNLFDGHVYNFFSTTLGLSEDFITNTLALIIAFTIVFIVWLLYFAGFGLQHKAHWFKSRASYAWSVVMGLSKNEYALEENEYSLEDNPTADDFRLFTRNLCNEVIVPTEQNWVPNKHLVIVFDNLDRISNEKVKEFFSFLQAFFVSGEFKQITTIVAFDRTHTAAAFDSVLGIRNIGNDYIQKTFDITYEVPRMGSLNLKNFFEKFWEDQFHTKSKQTDELLYIYRKFSNPNEINPRGLLVFINEIAALKKIIHFLDAEIIDDITIAIYILKKDQVHQFFRNTLKDPTGEISQTYQNTNSEFGKKIFKSDWDYIFHFFPDDNRDNDTKEKWRLARLEKSMGILYYKNELGYSNDSIRFRESLHEITHGYADISESKDCVYNEEYYKNNFIELITTALKAKKLTIKTIYSIQNCLKTLQPKLARYFDKDAIINLWVLVGERLLSLDVWDDLRVFEIKKNVESELKEKNGNYFGSAIYDSAVGAFTYAFYEKTKALNWDDIKEDYEDPESDLHKLIKLSKEKEEAKRKDDLEFFSKETFSFDNLCSAYCYFKNGLTIADDFMQSAREWFKDNMDYREEWLAHFKDLYSYGLPEASMMEYGDSEEFRTALSTYLKEIIYDCTPINHYKEIRGEYYPTEHDVWHTIFNFHLDNPEIILGEALKELNISHKITTDKFCFFAPYFFEHLNLLEYGNLFEGFLIPSILTGKESEKVREILMQNKLTILQLAARWPKESVDFMEKSGI